ncbi:MAG: hypothetical protein MZV64_30200 [Ignavibacteriales bacterium]|nr:hypothetical protein [Ignavibacteriales bacterium]
MAAVMEQRACGPRGRSARAGLRRAEIVPVRLRELRWLRRRPRPTWSSTSARASAA